MVTALSGVDNSKVILKLLFLKVLLSQILDISLTGVRISKDNSQLSLLSNNRDIVLGSRTLSLDFDLVPEELLEGGWVEDLVGDWLGAVDDDLLGGWLLLGFGRGHFGY